MAAPQTYGSCEGQVQAGGEPELAGAGRGLPRRQELNYSSAEAGAELSASRVAHAGDCSMDRRRPGCAAGHQGTAREPQSRAGKARPPRTQGPYCRERVSSSRPQGATGRSFSSQRTLVTLY